MDEKVRNIANTSLEVLEIYAKELLEKAKENAEDSTETDRNLHILNMIGCNMERLQRLKLEQPLGDFAD